MKTLIVILFLLPITLFGQITEPKHLHCIRITKYVTENIDTLNYDSLLVFFEQFSMEDNKNNVEFREWGNEVLFEVLSKRTNLFFETLFIMPTLQIKSIEDEINSPIHDGIDMIKLHNEVENSELDKNTKSRALNFINSSYESYKKMIEEWEKKNNKKWED